jgi:hypothetical protein
MLNWKNMADAANVLVTFVMIGTISSSIDNYDKECRADRLYCSLPLKRKDLVYAGYISGAIYTAFSILYILLSGLFLKGLFPVSLAEAVLLQPGEILYIILFISIIQFIEAVLPFLSDLQTNNKIGFFIYLVTTISMGIWVYPLLILTIARQFGHDVLVKRIFGLLKNTTQLLGQPVPALIVITFILLLTFISLKSAVRNFNQKDL